MRKKTRRRAGLLCLVWLFLTALPAAARADCALTVRYPCGGVVFRLYPVGTADLNGGYALTGDFMSYSVSFTDLDAQGWAGAAETLDACAARDGLEPLKTAATDGSGALTFSGLTPGLYLVTWSRHTTGGDVYTPQPFLVALPGAAGDAVTAMPKYGKAPASGGGRGERNSCAAELPKSSSAPAASPAPGAARSEPSPVPTAPADPSAAPVPPNPAGESGSNAVLAPADTLASDDTGDTIAPGEPKIPQTGQLWWPVPPLALAGLVLYLLGWWRARRADFEG